MPESREAVAAAQVVAWPRGLRWVAALLVALAGASVAQLGVRVLLDAVDGGARASPRAVVGGVLGGVLLPLALVAALRWLFAARLLLEEGRVRLASRFVRLEVPPGAQVLAHPWLLPLPSPGEWWELGPGERLARELEGGAPGALGAVAAPGGHAARAARAFAEARRRLHRSGPLALALKYGLFPLLLGAVLLRSYQHITFGAWNGEYQLFGLRAWLASAALYWGGTLVYLVVLAGTLRVAAELVCLSAAWALPASARPVRWAAEWLGRLAYFAGVPALLALRFLV
ncbi:hypothetical protein FGE12_27280 [Aggregicoccus sp. 17bor-14]|uniref:hypothetical protein n=1 Tax=Myxococcaceae TaxID=31 RepID=UPI00129CB7F5|nr:MULTISPECIES: hypothetical protein [Myxococcaceae]MBF5046149.1 hypothetical protein [Simulacricoccus sp. 17bor-14]MRI91875.1 hypothetical protein [Aggregicoccus sp. 17bor-14]